MVWILLLFFSLLIVLCCFLFFYLKAKIAISYSLSLADIHSIQISVTLLRIRLWKRTIYLPGVEKLLMEDSSLSPVISRINRKDITSFLKRTEVRNLVWETGIGTGVAHITGITTGFIWAGKELTVGMMGKYFRKVSEADLRVKPNYQGEGLYSKFDCSITVRYRTLVNFLSSLRKLKE